MHEDDIIARAAQFPLQHKLLLGIGDDAAVLAPQALPLVWTVDTLVENTHFLRAMPAAEIGWKALAVNLSDLAAMGATPLAALLSLSLPADLDPAWLQSFWQGLEAACTRYHVALAGGDSVRAREIQISLSLLGHSTRPVTRSGAKAGDLLVVSGAFGGAAAGLHCFKQGLDQPGLLRRHWHPLPRFEVAAALSQGCQQLAMLDTSDGLARSLQVLCEANALGCEVEGPLIPVEAGLAELAEAAVVRDWVLNGGEDFELLAAVDPAAAHWISTDPQLQIIGHLTQQTRQLIRYPDEVIELNGRDWGYQHFGDGALV
ncbi:MAG: thiamine-phosphate kinase [Candidatus Melainabacteria bacterium HGW-Melainabacteria-1]|nr:MAG: thiamine-phosphate kinase [Candidatus Melainabacteria bacterium HGW-Melainabacteria-1]